MHYAEIDADGNIVKTGYCSPRQMQAKRDSAPAGCSVFECPAGVCDESHVFDWDAFAMIGGDPAALSGLYVERSSEL